MISNLQLPTCQEVPNSYAELGRSSPCSFKDIAPGELLTASMGGTQSKEAPAPPPAVSVNTTQQQKEEDWKAPLANKKLPKELQALADKQDADANVWEEIYSGSAPESTDTNLRYAAYATRARTILLSAHRYVAYTSDIGESFRPIAHPYLIKGAYAVSWAYLIGDVSHEGYKAYLRQQQILHPEFAPGQTPRAVTNATTDLKQGNVNGLVQRAKNEASTIAHATQDVVTLPAGSGHVPAIEDYRAVMAQRAIFQSLASMGLPAFTIHSIVRYSGRALKDARNATVRTWGPIGVSQAHDL